MEEEEDILQSRIQEFSSLLFDLFEYTLNENFSPPLDGSITPTQLCTHVVTTMASLLRNENDYMSESTFTSEQFSSKILFLNNQSMVYIPHDSTEWTREVLGHVRRLIFRTIVVFCYVTIKGNNLLHIFLKNEETVNFIETVHGILNESKRKDSIPKLKITKDKVVDNLNMIGVKLSMGLLQDAFHSCEGLLQIGNVNVKQLMIAIGLLHEFNYCGGLIVIKMMLLSSGLFSNSPDTTNFQSIKSLLRNYRNLFATVKSLKTDYSHKVTCEKRSHKNCKTENEASLHHDVLGEIQTQPCRTNNDSSEDENLCVVSVTHQFLASLLKQTVEISNELTSMILLTIDRIGICSCMPPSVVILPILSVLPNMCDVKTSLAVLARLLLQLKTSNDFSTDVCLVLDCEVDNQLNVFRTAIEHNRLQIQDELVIEPTISLLHNNELQWLCVIVYKHLLLFGSHRSTHCNLSVLKDEVLCHLEIIASNLQSSAILAIFTLVLMPIIALATHTPMSSTRGKTKVTRAESSFSEKELSKDALERCLRLATQLLRNNEICRKAFVRHNGIKALVKLLTQEQISQMKFSESSSLYYIQEAALQTLTVFLTNPTMLSQEVSTSVLKFMQNSEEDSSKKSSEIKPSSLRTLFQSKFKQSSPKRDKSVFSSCENEQDMKWTLCKSNEVKSFTTGVKKIVKIIKEFTLKTCRMQLVLGNAQLNPDSPDGYFEDDLYGSSSDTTGYESRSRTSSFLSDENNDLALPFDDVSAMQELHTLWKFYARTLQYNKELLEFFSVYDGPDISLKLLYLSVLSLVPPRQITGSDFTNSLNMTQHENADSASVNTISRAASRSPSISSMKEPATLAETTSITNALSTANSFVIATEDFNSNERMEAKLEFVSTMLNVSLLCTVVNGDDEAAVSVDEVISTVKPLLQQSKLSESTYCRDLCRGLFRAAVEENIPQEYSDKPSVVSLMSVLRRQINNVHSQKSVENWFERLQTPVKSSKNQIKRSSSQLSELEDDWLFYNDISSDEYTASDGYRGDSESDSSEFKGNSLVDDRNSLSGDLGVSDQKIFQQQSEALVPASGIIHPDILMLIVELLAERDHIFQLFFSDSSNVKELNQQDINKMKDFCGDVKVVVRTLQCLADHSSENIDLLTSSCDITTACFVAFSFGFQNETQQFKSLQEDIFQLCLTLNKHCLSSAHLTTIFSFLNGKNPPVEKLVNYLSELVSSEQIGPSSFLRFPDISISDKQSTPCMSPIFTSSKLSSWKIAATKFNLGSCISWPSYDAGVTIVTWLKINKETTTAKTSKKKLRKRAAFPSTWSSPQVVHIDLQGHGQTDNRSCVHLMSVGSKQIMLQVWLNHDVLIFRICVDPNDNKTVGILAETHCPDLLSSGEWLHLAFTYSESKMPDKAILGKVHLIVNSSIERDVLLEYNCPYKSIKKMDTYLMLGHCDVIDSSPANKISVSYNFGNVSIFDHVHFTRGHMEVLDFFGADRTTLSSCIISDADSSLSEAASKSKVKYTRRLQLSTGIVVESKELSKVDMQNKLSESLVAVFQSNLPSICLVKSQSVVSLNEKKSIFTRGFLSYQTGANSVQEQDLFTQEFTKIHSLETNGTVQVVHYKGLHQVLQHLGGIRVFVMFFAKVVEVTNEGQMSDIKKEQLQCAALQTVMNLRAHDPTRKKEFLENNCCKLLYKVLSKQQCMLGYHMLRVLFNACCENDAVIEAIKHEEQPPDFNVNFDTNAVIHDQELFQHFIADAKLWRKSRPISSQETGDTSYPVWQSLMHGIRSLIREDHPYQWKNIKEIISGKFIEKNLMDLQQIVADGEKDFPNKNVTMLIVDVINTVSSNVPAAPILKNIADFLLAIHPPAGTFVCHSPSSFYFNLLTESKTSNRKNTRKNLSKSNPASPTDPAFSLDEKFGLVRTISAPASSPWKQATRRASMLSGNMHTSSSEGHSLKMSEDSLSTINEEINSKKNINGDIASNGVGKNKPTCIVQNNTKVFWENLPHVSNPIELVTSPMRSIDILTDDPGIDREEKGDVENRSDRSITDFTLELLRMLYLFTMNMSENDTAEFLGTCITSANLIVMTHHDSADVRAATIRLLSAFFAKCSQTEHESFLQMKGFHLVANQLHQHSSDREIVEACFFILLGHQVLISDPLSFDLDITDPLQNHRSDPFKNHAIIFLLSLLENTCRDVYLCKDLTRRLIELFENLGPIADVMLDNGLTIALCNLIISTMLSKQSLEDKEGIIVEVEYFLSLIAMKSCVTSGSAHFNVFEDLMTLLYVVESYFADSNHVSSYPVLRLQAISHRILLQAFDSMPKTSSGKSPTVYRRNDSSGSMTNVDSNALRNITILNDIVFDSNAPTSQRRASLTPDHPRSPLSMISVSSGISRNTAHKRSLSSSTTGDGSSSFNSGWRSRSYKGTQRRKVSENETARRLQRIVTIAVERITFKRQNHGSGRDVTLKVEDEFSSRVLKHRDIIQTIVEANRKFDGHVFNLLINWLSGIASANQNSKRSSMRSRLTLLTSLSYTPAWERILTISKSSLMEQAGNLLVHLLSPWQSDFATRLLPLSLAQTMHCEKLLSWIIPAKSEHTRKISVYTYYLLCYYKQNLTPQNKKDLKHFCKIVYKLGHKIIPIPTANKKVGFETSSQEGDMNGKNMNEITMENIEKDQESFDNERQMFEQVCRKQNLANFSSLNTRTNRLAEIVSNHAMDVTREVVLKQNIERKKMIAGMKTQISDDLLSRQQWSCLIEQLTHERAVWHDSTKYPSSWQLDNTEGPNRERKRLQRCHLQIPNRFMLDNNTKESKLKVGKVTSKSHCTVAPAKPLAFIFEDDSHTSDSVTIRTRLQTNERIMMVQSCMIVTPSCETSGEILIGEKNVYFVGDELLNDPMMVQATFSEKEVLTLSWRHQDFTEISKRWWQLRDVAIEIFLSNGKTYLIAFKDVRDRDLILDELNRIDLPNLLQQNDLSKLTQLWRSGKKTNFEYLTQLNKFAGRSFNDLMQYPIMPFVLADYKSTILNLNDPKMYRNLLKPISVQDSEREEHYRERYNFLQYEYNNCQPSEREMRTAPFHYGSHYSNSGTVLHFLVRLPPFTRMFLEYQDDSFDIPDRTFHSLETTYKLSSFASTTDVKELIPEFFFMPEFLCNLEGFDFGLRQCGLRVHHVNLPLWCKTDPRLFVLIHRQALESDFVRSRINGWIDLVFGFKQMGKLAIDSVNVFHPATYFGMDITSVKDPVKRRALETMVKTYGQTPKQLFDGPHLPSQASIQTSDGSGDNNDGNFSQNKNPATCATVTLPRPLPSVEGLKWGNYIGSPACSPPTVFLLKPLSTSIGRLVALETNDVCVLSPKMSLLVIYHQDENNEQMKSIHWSALLTYGHADNIVRLKLRQNVPGINLMTVDFNDKTTCCVSDPDCRLIVFGKKSGKIFAYRCLPCPDKTCDLEILSRLSLFGHASDITNIVACSTFRILVSASKDGTAIIWDLDNLCYVRSLTGHATALTAIAVSNTSGDICTVCESGNDSGSHIRLWTINGSLVAAQDSKQRVHCVAFSASPEGISVNVVAGGLHNGVIRLWSSWDLSPVRDIETHSISNPIVSLTFTHNNMTLYAATSDGVVIAWCCRDRLKDRQPLLITFVNIKK